MRSDPLDGDRGPHQGDLGETRLPVTSRSTMKPEQHRLQCTPRRRPCRHVVRASGGLPAASELAALPGGELKNARGEHDHTGRDRTGWTDILRKFEATLATPE